MKKQVSKEGTSPHAKFVPIFVKIELIIFSFLNKWKWPFIFLLFSFLKTYRIKIQLHDHVNDSQPEWNECVSIRNEFELEFSGSTEPSRAEPSQAGALKFLSWNQAEIF